jgi:hypothetical protein
MKRVLTLCVLLAGSFLTAQDSRAVTEPAIPQPCVSLEAKLTMSGDHLTLLMRASSTPHESSKRLMSVLRVTP